MPYPVGITYQDTSDALRASRNFYPNATTLAEFRPSSLTLHFHYLTRETYSNILARPASADGRREVETVMHELTHWSDQISTVWGQEHLIRVFDAYNSAFGGREEHFYKTIDLHDEERRILFPIYYKTIEDTTSKHDVDRPWIIHFSAGQEFSPDGRINPQRPIFFVTFSDHDTRMRVARQPISVGALLETTATWMETITGLNVLSRLPEDAGIVEQHLWARERADSLYNPDLTVYTAPVHMLARFADISDVVTAYERAAVLAHVCLNMTEDTFRAIRHPEAFAPFGDRRAAFVEAQDRGYAFAVLARHASDINVQLSVEDWLAAVLEAAGCPPYDELIRRAHTRLEEISHLSPPRTELDQVRDYLLEVGRERFAMRMPSGFANGRFDPLGPIQGPMPPMFDANAELFAVGNEVLDQRRYDPETMHYAEFRLRNFTSNFLQGSRGITTTLP